jgi:hypothetical protein
VHRDLKPSNVLVSPDGPRVIDFGVARAAERISLTVTRGAVGTPAYMAPEQARDTRQASAASDVFSLGATLLYAVTGHPPYGGDTVMDVLVRLATEPPDLAGLPGDLTGLVTACLERSPRKRPSSAALLERLGQQVIVAPGNGQAHPYLGAAAMALISQYQRGPETGAFEGIDGGYGDGDEATFGSRSVLPALPVPRRRRWWRGRRRPAARRPAGDGGPRWWRAAALVGAALVLVAAGAAGGALLRPAGGSAAGRGQASSPPAATPSAGTPVNGFGPPGGLPPPNVVLPPGASASPSVTVLQPQGDGNTVFLIHGSGWRPLSRITVALAGHGASPLHPVTDLTGTFNYAIDQGHKFFAGPLPPGVYRVVVTSSAGGRASVRFDVVPPPPPGGGPPPGP